MKLSPTYVHILFGTATGTAEDVAEGLAEYLGCRGAVIKTFSAVDDYPIAQLPTDASNNELFVFIVSTCGDGQVPVTMRKFWQFIRRADLPSSILDDLKFAIFGLGDRAYVKFNAAARKLCTRLCDLGASLLVPLALGDDSADGGYDKELLSWTDALASIISPDQPESGAEQGTFLKEPRLVVEFLDSEPSSRALQCSHDKWQPGQARLQTEHNASGLFEAHVLSNKIVTNSNFLTDEKEVRHVVLDVTNAPDGTGLRNYEPGDVVHIMPRNKESVVDAFFEITDLDAEAVVNVTAHQSKNRFSEYPLNIRTPSTLREFVSSQLDLTATPRRRFFERLAPFATNSLERDKILEFASAQGAEALCQYAYREKRTILMTLRDFPSVQVPLEHLIDMIPVLKPRPFSIASSSIAHKGRIHVCASIVRYKTPLRFLRVGVCSSFLLRLFANDIVPVFLEKGSSLRFHEDKPAIMVAPGTGVAPMRAFLSSVQSSGTCRVLFFGCRTKEADFLYENEWSSFMISKQLTRLITAFSRENQAKKVYVQDKMLEEADFLWSLVSLEDAHVYVAGSAGAMPKAVRQALVDICHIAGKLSDAASEAYVRRMEVEGRLQMECW